MVEDIIDEPKAETHSTGPCYGVRGALKVSPALHERLIEAGWTPPEARFETESGGGVGDPGERREDRDSRE
jgi:hypothetical protein